jgi:hypothetical protein
VAQLTAKHVPLILMGTGVFSSEEMTAYLQDLDYSALMLGYEKIIAEMDTVADILFQRVS